MWLKGLKMHLLGLGSSLVGLEAKKFSERPSVFEEVLREEREERELRERESREGEAGIVGFRGGEEQGQMLQLEKNRTAFERNEQHLMAAPVEKRKQMNNFGHVAAADFIPLEQSGGVGMDMDDEMGMYEVRRSTRTS